MNTCCVSNVEKGQIMQWYVIIFFVKIIWTGKFLIISKKTKLIFVQCLLWLCADNQWMISLKFKYD